LAQLVDDLLDVSTIASGKLTLQPWLVDLVEFIQRNITLNRILAERKQIHIHFRCQDDIPKIMIDAAKIEQVLNNLISNAIKFSNPDMNITITVSKQENWINIAVQDEGPGIPAQEQEGMFDLFARTSVKSTSGEKSTGLGLAIAQKIVEAHNGKIRVESVVGKGSTFFVDLPVKSH
jgi:two-component system sensor histidine kinase/response regulator